MGGVQSVVYLLLKSGIFLVNLKIHVGGDNKLQVYRSIAKEVLTMDCLPIP